VIETEVEVTLLVRGDAVEGVDYDPEEVGWMWAVTLEQDMMLCERTQQGIQSSVYAPGPHSEDEASVGEFLDWYLRLLEGGLTKEEGRATLTQRPRM
jgi:Rieske 2Fe-2S family protein